MSQPQFRAYTRLYLLVVGTSIVLPAQIAKIDSNVGIIKNDQIMGEWQTQTGRLTLPPQNVALS